MRRIAVLFCMFLFSAAFAEDIVPKEAGKDVPEGKAEGPKPGKPKGIETWEFGFGLGVEQYKDDYIESASIHGEDKIVAVEKKYETLPSAWLTANVNFWGISDTIRDYTGRDVKNTKGGIFLGVKLIDSNSEAFSAFAIGPQVSLEMESQVISIGFGWVAHGTKEFAGGIEEGSPLPKQYDDIVYTEGTENSYMVMVSVGI